MKKAIETIAIHSGEEVDPTTGASSPGIVTASTFVSHKEMAFTGETYDPDQEFRYGRWGNPTVRQLEIKLAALEEGKDALSFATGMAAIAGLLFHELKKGDRLVMGDIGYAGLRELGNMQLKDLGIDIAIIDTSNLKEVEEALKIPTKLIFFETPSNPILRLADIEGIIRLAKKYKTKVAIDNTFSTPINTQPLKMGADYVVHSLTKYICGHGDALGGAVIGASKEDMLAMRWTSGIHLGGSLSPFNAWLISRGAHTLPIRMRAHSEGAMKVAEYLDKHPNVVKTFYPGLPSHPQHELAKKQMKSFSGMITFQTKECKKAEELFRKKLEVIHYAVSLGHQRSLMFYLNTADMQESTFILNSKQLEQFKAFAGEGFFRLSIGIEHPNDLIADLARVLDVL